MGRILLIAHKGITSEGACGNTLKDFKKAEEAGVDMIEMDIRRTKDNVLITHYGEDISGVFLKNITYKTANEIASKRGYEIPKLEDVIQEFPDIRFDLELKEEGYEDVFVKLLHTYLPDKSRYIVSSFNDRSVTLVKNADPEIQAGLRLYERAPKEGEFIETRVSEVFPFKRVDKCGADFIAFHWKLLPAGLLWRAQKRGLSVYIWGIDPRTNLKPFLKNPALKGIITDKFFEVQKILKGLEE